MRQTALESLLLDSLTLDTLRLRESEDILLFLTFDTDNPASIASTIASARENARQVREQLSSEMWMQLNKLYLTGTKIRCRYCLECLHRMIIWFRSARRVSSISGRDRCHHES